MADLNSEDSDSDWRKSKYAHLRSVRAQFYLRSCVNCTTLTLTPRTKPIANPSFTFQVCGSQDSVTVLYVTHCSIYIQLSRCFHSVLPCGLSLISSLSILFACRSAHDRSNASPDHSWRSGAIPACESGGSACHRTALRRSRSRAAY